jgi:transcriptional regulator with XRE-family HTH domain
MSTAIGQRLKECRLGRGISQTTLAKIGGVNKGSQISYERGKRKPNSEYLQRLGEAGFDIQYLLMGTACKQKAQRLQIEVLPDAPHSEFNRLLLKVKLATGLREDQQIAQLLGMSHPAFSARKVRDAFPIKALKALAFDRPELHDAIKALLVGADA